MPFAVDAFHLARAQFAFTVAFLRGDLAHRWFSRPSILFTAPVPILVGLLALAFFRSLAGGRDRMPIVCVLGWFVLCFAGLGISLFPLIVPPSLTIWEAAAPRASQEFLLVGAAVMIPAILAYSGYAYWVFRGKVQHDARVPLMASRLAWFAGLWAASAAVTALFAYGLRWILLG